MPKVRTKTTATVLLKKPLISNKTKRRLKRGAKRLLGVITKATSLNPKRKLKRRSR